VNYIDVPYWLGAIGDITVQVKLFETTNCIEIHTTQAGLSSAAGNSTQGIENGDGTEAHVYPGRNNTSWEAINSFISFCPIDSSGLLYTWSSGHVGATAIGLEPGTYTVTATDANGCFATDDVTIDPAPSNFVSAANSTNVSCFGFDDATVDPGISGGVAPITYIWNNNATTSTLTNTEPGTYSVSATDNLGCTIEVNNIVITEPDILLGSVYDVQNVVCENDVNGSASVTVGGGTAPYTPVWSSGEIGFSASGLSSGQNYVEVTDANGCEVFVPVNILFTNPAPTPQLGNNILLANGGTATLSTAPTTYPSYIWSTGETTTTIDVSTTGSYWVQVANAAGCSGSDSIFVEIWPTGIEEMNTLTGVSFFPNPARDQITFDINADIEELNITITDAKGSVVATQTFLNGGMATLDVANLPAGVYSMNLKSDDLNATERLVISK